MRNKKTRKENKCERKHVWTSRNISFYSQTKTAVKR